MAREHCRLDRSHENGNRKNAVRYRSVRLRLTGKCSSDVMLGAHSTDDPTCAWHAHVGGNSTGRSLAAVESWNYAHDGSGGELLLTVHRRDPGYESPRKDHSPHGAARRTCKATIRERMNSLYQVQRV